MWTRSSNESLEINYILSHLDPLRNQYEPEVDKINHLQNLWNKLSAANAPIKMDVLVGQSYIANDFNHPEAW
jgi:hypothetical protein